MSKVIETLLSGLVVLFLCLGLVIVFNIIEDKLGHPILLVNNECILIRETTEGVRARIAELEKEGKGIYEVLDVLEEEGYIKETVK